MVMLNLLKQSWYTGFMQKEKKEDILKPLKEAENGSERAAIFIRESLFLVVCSDGSEQARGFW